MPNIIDQDVNVVPKFKELHNLVPIIPLHSNFIDERHEFVVVVVVVIVVFLTKTSALQRIPRHTRKGKTLPELQ